MTDEEKSKRSLDAKKILDSYLIQEYFAAIKESCYNNIIRYAGSDTEAVRIAGLVAKCSHDFETTFKDTIAKGKIEKQQEIEDILNLDVNEHRI